MTMAFSKLGVLSPDCQCKTFDASANGYVRSEGCGVLILQRLDRAIAEKNHIYCVIDAVMCNEDGMQSPSLTMPSSQAQQDLIRKTLTVAKVDPTQVFYVEAHGEKILFCNNFTGTGDPIEASAITNVLCASARKDKLKIGTLATTNLF